LDKENNILRSHAERVIFLRARGEEVKSSEKPHLF